MQRRQPNPAKKKLLVSGGHLTPALAILERLQDQGDWELVYLGRKVTAYASHLPNPEWQELQRLGVRLAMIPAGKVPRHLSIQNLWSYLRIPVGFLAALRLLMQERPDIILTFGGYLAAPTAVGGKLLGLPVVAHEQTLTKGLANLLVEWLANVIAVAWPETEKHFRRKVTVTGNPLRQAIVRGVVQPVPIRRDSLPLLYVTGGNQGAHAINAAIADALPELLRSWSLVHQCGWIHEREDYRSLMSRKANLPVSLRGRYLVREWFTTQEVSWLLRQADLVVARAGANTVAELMFTGAIALLIPLPISGRGEQLANARFMRDLGTAEILPQELLSSDSLLRAIGEMHQHISHYRGNAKLVRSKVPPDGAERLIRLIDDVLG